MQTVDEVDLFVVLGEREGMPFCLLGESVDFWVDGEKAVLDVGLGLDRYIALCYR